MHLKASQSSATKWRSIEWRQSKSEPVKCRVVLKSLLLLHRKSEIFWHYLPAILEKHWRKRRKCRYNPSPSMHDFHFTLYDAMIVWFSVICLEIITRSSVTFIRFFRSSSIVVCAKLHFYRCNCTSEQTPTKNRCYLLLCCAKMKNLINLTGSDKNDELGDEHKKCEREK